MSNVPQFQPVTLHLHYFGQINPSLLQLFNTLLNKLFFTFSVYIIKEFFIYNYYKWKTSSTFHKLKLTIKIQTKQNNVIKFSQILPKVFEMDSQVFLVMRVRSYLRDIKNIEASN